MIKYLVDFSEQNNKNVSICLNEAQLTGGDILFLISCSRIIGSQIRSNYKNTMVVHASDLPKGRGWSPYVWQILEGKSELVFSLIEAVDKVDRGPVWHKSKLHIPREAIFEEIADLIAKKQIELIEEGCKLVKAGRMPQKQNGGLTSYYPRRTPSDSAVEPGQTIGEIFDLLRVCDPENYPVFFHYRGRRFSLILKGIEDA